METCSPNSHVGAEQEDRQPRRLAPRRVEPGLGTYPDGRKLCFNHLGVPTGSGRELMQERNREGQVGHLGHSQLIK